MFLAIYCGRYDLVLTLLTQTDASPFVRDYIQLKNMLDYVEIDAKQTEFIRKLQNKYVFFSLFNNELLFFLVFNYLVQVVNQIVYVFNFIKQFFLNLKLHIIQFIIILIKIFLKMFFL